jgi:hypothetical protein
MHFITGNGHHQIQALLVKTSPTSHRLICSRRSQPIS